MFLANPAALGLWHAAKSPSDWGLPLVTTYSATVGGLGESLARTIAFNFMLLNTFTSVNATLNTLFQSDEHLSPVVANALYLDPYYGLEDPGRIAKWHVACREDEVAKLEF